MANPRFLSFAGGGFGDEPTTDLANPRYPSTSRGGA